MTRILTAGAPRWPPCSRPALRWRRRSRPPGRRPSRWWRRLRSPACTAWRSTPKAGCWPAASSATRSGKSTGKTGAPASSSGRPKARPTTSRSDRTARLAWTNFLMGMVRYPRERRRADARAGQGPAGPQLARLRPPQRQALRQAGVPGRRAVGDRRRRRQAAAADRQGHGRLQRLRSRPRRHAVRPAVVQGPGREDRPGQRRDHRHQQRVQDSRRGQPRRQGQPLGRRHRTRAS